MKINLTEIPVVYINLDRDTEKRSNMEKLFSDHGFKNTHRSPGVIVPHEHVCVGISYAFRNAFQLAFSVSDGGPFLMVEDDLVTRESFRTEIELPDDFDACYLGISTWARVNGISGPYLRGDFLEENSELLRIYNMLSGHAILYSGNEYSKVVHSKMTKAIMNKTYQDIEFAETMGDFNVYAFADPFFYQTSSKEVTDLSIGVPAK